MKKADILSILAFNEGDPISILKRLGGYYEGPKNGSGKRLGLLVGYAGKYTDKDGKEKQYVGDIYVNCAKAENYPAVLDNLALHLGAQAEKSGLSMNAVDAFCAALMGGICFGTILGLFYEKRFCYPEKKITALKTGTTREESKLVFDRHEIYKGEKVAIVEDVSNNFSTTKELSALIEKSGGEVVGIISILNRSVTKENVRETGDLYEYILPGGRAIPVVSLERKAIPQYRQDETPEIEEMIAQGRVVWKPKDEWHRLMDAMPESA